MNRNTKETATGKPAVPGNDEGVLDRLAQSIDPPSREISDDEILDPGANIPREPMEKRDPGKPAGGRRH